MMIRITLTGWHTGLDKVRLNHLLRQYAGLTLAGAKRAVDDLLAGRPASFEANEADADAFCRAATEAGAIWSASPEAQPIGPTSASAKR